MIESFGPYGDYVLSAYGVAFVILMGLWVVSFLAVKKNRRILEAKRKSLSEAGFDVPQ